MTVSGIVIFGKFCMLVQTMMTMTVRKAFTPTGRLDLNWELGAKIHRSRQHCRRSVRPATHAESYAVFPCVSNKYVAFMFCELSILREVLRTRVHLTPTGKLELNWEFGAIRKDKADFDS